MNVQKLFSKSKGNGYDKPSSATVINDENGFNSHKTNTTHGDLVDFAESDLNRRVTSKKEKNNHHHHEHGHVKPTAKRATSLLDVFRASSSSGFLTKNKKEKEKEKEKEKVAKPKKKGKKKKDSASVNAKDDNESKDEGKDSNSLDLSIGSSNPPSPQIDDEGYIVRPKSASQTKSVDSFYSSSDSDSDSEEKVKKIHVKIKPLTNGQLISASVDELIASVGTLSLSPAAHYTRRRNDAFQSRIKNRRIYSTTSSKSSLEDGMIKKSISATNNISKPEKDLVSEFNSNANTRADVTPQSHSHLNNNNHNSKNGSQTSSNNSKGIPCNDRYAALRELFDDATANENDHEQSAGSSGSSCDSSTLSNSASSNTLCPSMPAPPPPPLIPLAPLPPLSLTSLPRPPSKKSINSSPQLSHQNSLSRCESMSSLSSDFRMTPLSVFGPSLNLIPIAIAFQESISAFFQGKDEARCQVNLVGSLKMAFPAGIVQVIENNPYLIPLTFKLNKFSQIKKLFHNKELINDYDATTQEDPPFELNMPSLTNTLKRLSEQNPNAPYYTIELVKYQAHVMHGAKSAPLHLIAHWKCDETSTSLKIDYKYNSSAFSKFEPIRNVTFVVSVDGGVTSMQAVPQGNWNAATNQMSWRFDQISFNSEGRGLGSVKARFELSSGPSTPSAIQTHFTCTNGTISGINFELTSLGYRVSLVKKQVSSGKYICE